MDKFILAKSSESLKLKQPLPLTLHPAAVYLDSLAQGSQLTMKWSLDTMASILTHGECDALTLDWSKLRYRHTSLVRSVLKSKLAAPTVNKMLSALRRVLQEARKLDLMTQVDLVSAIDVPNVKTNGKLRGRALNPQEIQALMASCLDSSKPIDVRDAALMAILRGGGLRRAELVNLDLSDFQADLLRLDIHLSKGNKDRVVYLPVEAISLINKWLSLRGSQSGPLLCPVNKGGQVQLRRMCTDAVFKILRERARKAGIESFSPHDLRRTFCGDLLDAGVDLVTVQKLAGHASPVTTAKYDRRGEETKLRAVQNLSF